VIEAWRRKDELEVPDFPQRTNQIARQSDNAPEGL